MKIDIKENLLNKILSNTGIDIKLKIVIIK